MYDLMHDKNIYSGFKIPLICGLMAISYIRIDDPMWRRPILIHMTYISQRMVEGSTRYQPHYEPRLRKFCVSTGKMLSIAG
jgi:hypothetical protein